MRQFSVLPPHILTRLEEKNLTVDKLKDMRKDEIGKKEAKCFKLLHAIKIFCLMFKKSIMNFHFTKDKLLPFYLFFN